MAPRDPVPDERWDAMLQQLSSMISAKRRADGSTWADAHENMPTYLRRLGIAEAVQQLRVIHVAGTKGKGSTCAMVESILRSSGYSTGLFTSPHLCDVRERVRLNGHMVPKARFCDAFWRCHDSLTAAATPDAGMPGYFRFLTLLALQVFIDAAPDVVILEVGIGGRIDATNIIRRPAVTGITSLGFDHMELLGDTLDLIAREKAGIMRAGVPCCTVPQPPEAMQALEACAAETGAQLQLAPSLAQFRHACPGQAITVGLAGEHQQLNASLAVALVRNWEQHAVAQQQQQQQPQQEQQQQQQEPAAAASGQPSECSGAAGDAAARLQQLDAGVLPASYCQGLSQAAWPGRSQIVAHPRFAEPGGGSLTFFLDGAHTPESMLTCAAWFAQVAQPQPPQQQQPAQQPQRPQQPAPQPAQQPALQQQQQQQPPLRVLLFNCMKERDPGVLLPHLHSELRARGGAVHAALFVPPDSQYAFLPSSATSGLVAAAHADLSWQQQLADVWRGCQRALGDGGDDGGGTAAAALLPPLPDVPGVGQQDLASGDGAAVLRCMADALAWVERAAEAAPGMQVQVLVTGSLYLVGDCLKGLHAEPE